MVKIKSNEKHCNKYRILMKDTQSTIHTDGLINRLRNELN